MSAHMLLVIFVLPPMATAPALVPFMRSLPNWRQRALFFATVIAVEALTIAFFRCGK